jgi:exosortase
MDSTVNTPSGEALNAGPVAVSTAPLDTGEFQPAPAPGLNKVTGLLLLLGCLPLVVAFFANLWQKEYYQFYPLALAGVAFLGWLRWQEVPKPLTAGTGGVSLMLMGSAFLVLLAATYFWSPWVGMVGALIGLAGATWWLGGWPLFRALLPAGILLLTVLPPPLNLDVRFTMKLRSVATQWSSAVLDGMGVTHALNGNVIEIPNQRLMVEEACSGINSILSTTAVCLFYCLWRRRPAVQIVIMLVMTVGFVLLGNVTRIVSGAWLRYQYNINILSGWKHETVGLILFASYLGLILSADQLLTFFSEPSAPAPRPPKADTPPPAVAVPSGIATVASGWAWVAGLAFALLGLGQLGHAAYRSQRAGPLVIEGAKVLQSGTLFSLPDQIGPWRRLREESTAPTKVELRGINSQVWQYQCEGLTATLALDYPFKGYHDVTICYTGNGWDMLQKETRSEPTGGPEPAGYVDVRMQREMLVRGTLLFSTLDEHGRWIDGSYLKRNLSERFRSLFSEQTIGTTYRVQVLVPSFLPLTPTTEDQVRSLFLQARKLLREQLAGQLQKK